MLNQDVKQCKSKGCNNSVLKGKYCEYCKKNIMENIGKGLSVAGSFAFLCYGAIKKRRNIS